MAPRAFISYSHADERFCIELHKRLTNLARQGIIDSWSDRRIEPGQLWEGVIDENLEGAHMFLPLISADFFVSDYCYQKEMHRALEKHDLNELLVVHIIVRPCTWKESPIAKIQVLPLHGKPIDSWRNHDKARL